MFARKVSARLRPELTAQFLQKIQNEIIPLLRKQRGFLDEFTLISQNGKEAYAYSFWNNGEDAELYDRTAFREVTDLLAGLIEGSVRTHTYTVANSTFHKIAAAAVAA